MKTTNTTLNLSDEIKKVEKRLPSMEYTLSKGLKQPFNNTNSGSRKIMQAIQMEQNTQLLESEVPIVSTGYENQFGQYSSNFIVADHDYKVIAKIPKIKSDPNRHYWLITYCPDTNTYDCIERVAYKHITEFYGYLFNNKYLDKLDVGSEINKGDTVKKTISYDEYNNRAEGINLSTMYIACEDVKEDPIVISESAAKRFMAPLIDKVEIKINDNDILLNLYGNEIETYKTFPDIGEKIKNNILCAVRREMKDEEALFSQSWERLKTIMINDKKFIVDGTVIDIDIYCNNPEKLDQSMYNTQIKKYYEASLEFSQKVVDVVKPIMFEDDGETPKAVNISYDLQKLYHKSLKAVNGVRFISDRVFNNILMVIYVQQNKSLHAGDKITDRYGGKGVISKVKPDNLMPHYYKNGKWVPVDVLYSMCTCVNRLNPGQLFETSVTYIGWRLLEYIGNALKNDDSKENYDKAFALIYKYQEMLNPEQAKFLAEQFEFTYDSNNPDWEDNEYKRNFYIDTMVHEGRILVSLEPISTHMNIDMLRDIYDAFPFIPKYCPVCGPIKDSAGNYRMVRTRRDLTIGYKYIFRLKQLAEEKFSAVSLASTNIRNENSKSRMSKVHNAKFASTPVRIFGEMESSSIMAHLGVENYYQELMLNSASPSARRSHSQLLTGDPFKFNIDLDTDAISQPADVCAAYLKTLGVRIRHIKIRKFINRPIIRSVVERVPLVKRNLVYVIPKDVRDKGRDEAQKYLDKLVEEDKKHSEKGTIQVVSIIPGVYEQTKAEEAYREKLRDLGLKDD